jgi:hypothetical protein
MACLVKQEANQQQLERAHADLRKVESPGD